MIYAIEGQGRTALVEGPDGEDVNGLWDEFLGAVRENIGERPSGDRPFWEARRLRYLQDCVECFQGVRPDRVDEVGVFLALLVHRLGFRAVDPEPVLLTA